MKHALQAGMVVGAFVLALVGPSCVSSDMIENSQGNITLQVVSTAPAAGYPWAKIVVRQMSFRPTSPGALQDGLVLLPFALNFDMNSATTPAEVRVTAQRYSLDAFRASFELNIVPSQPPGSVCNGSVLESFREGEESDIVPTCEFTVPPSGAVPVTIQVDGAGLAALLASKFPCPSGGYTPPTSAELLQFLTFQCEP